MPSLSGGLSGAAQGAQMGTMIMPGYGTVIGAVAGGLLGAFGAGGSKNVQPRGYTPADITTGQQSFLDQGKNIGDVSRLLGEANRIDNLNFQQQASQFAPNLFGNIATNAATTGDFLQGQLSGGIQNALGKNGATARDLGLTPYQLELRGANRVGIEGDTARKLNPFNETATDTLISPSALLKRQDQLDLQNNEILNQGKLMAAGASATNPTGQGLSAGLGSLFGNLRGYGTIGQNNGGGGSGGGMYGFGTGDTGPTADSMFSGSGDWMGGT